MDFYGFADFLSPHFTWRKVREWLLVTEICFCTFVTVFAVRHLTFIFAFLIVLEKRHLMRVWLRLSMEILWNNFMLFMWVLLWDVYECCFCKGFYGKFNAAIIFFVGVFVVAWINGNAWSSCFLLYH